MEVLEHLLLNQNPEFVLDTLDLAADYELVHRELQSIERELVTPLVSDEIHASASAASKGKSLKKSPD